MINLSNRTKAAQALEQHRNLELYEKYSLRKDMTSSQIEKVAEKLSKAKADKVGGRPEEYLNGMIQHVTIIHQFALSDAETRYAMTFNQAFKANATPQESESLWAQDEERIKNLK